VAAFLSQGWLDEVAERGASLPSRPGVGATIQHIVTGAPDGEVRYHQSVVDGQVQEAALGEIEDPDLLVTTTYAEAQRVARGEVSAPAAFMQGKLKVAGSSGRVMDLMPLLDSPEYRDLTAALSEATEY
jgi:alkyl sulfatase BDS1-like metallo-beta-lactamase superfamily hydrolase